MPRHYKVQSIRIHQSYDVSEVADLLGVTQQTIRIWIKAGLPILGAQRPTLILGCALRAFLEHQKAKAKRPTAQDEFYCLHCRKAQKPFGMLVDYIPVDESRGRLVALCEVCEGCCYRFASKASLPELSRVFEITISMMKQA